MPTPKGKRSAFAMGNVLRAYAYQRHGSVDGEKAMVQELRSMASTLERNGDIHHEALIQRIAANLYNHAVKIHKPLRAGKLIDLLQKAGPGGVIVCNGYGVRLVAVGGRVGDDGIVHLWFETQQ